MSLKSTIKKVAKTVGSAVRSAVSTAAGLVSPASVVKAVSTPKVTTTPSYTKVGNTYYANQGSYSSAKGYSTPQTQVPKTSTSKTSTSKTSQPINYTSAYQTLVPTSSGKSGGSTSAYQTMIPSTSGDYSGSYSSLFNSLSSNFTSGTGPNNATAISTGIGRTNIPTPITTRQDVSDAYSYTKGSQEMLNREDQYLNDFYSQKLEKEQTRQKEQTSWLQDLMGQKTTREEEEARIREREEIMSFKQFQAQKAGVQAQINTLKDEYSKIEQQLNQQIATITNSEYGTMDFLNARTAAMERNAAPRLNRLAAQINLQAAELAAIDQNWEASEKFINDAVDATMAEQKQNLDLAFEFYNINQDMFDRIDKIYSESYKEALETKQAEIDYQRSLYKAEYTQKMQQKYAGTTTTGATRTTELTDFTFQNLITELKNSGATYEQVVQEINVDPNISNKERGIEIAKQLFGISSTQPSTTVQQNQTKTGISAPKINPMSPAGVIDLTPTIKSFFSNLFS